MTRKMEKSLVIMMGETLVSGFMDREQLEDAYARIGTALRELDISEGKAKPGDEGVCDLGGNPFQCAHQQ